MQGQLGMSHGIFQNDVRKENNLWDDDFGGLPLLGMFWTSRGLYLPASLPYL